MSDKQRPLTPARLAQAIADRERLTRKNRLAKAAPDLLAALEDVAAFGTLNPRLVSVVRAAIAKTEPEEGG